MQDWKDELMEKHETRYTVSIAVDVYAKDDMSAYKKALKVLETTKKGFNARIFELEETPFASFEHRNVNFHELDRIIFEENELKESTPL